MYNLKGGDVIKASKILVNKANDMCLLIKDTQVGLSDCFGAPCVYLDDFNSIRCYKFPITWMCVYIKEII
jgi:hypothetical protein